VEAICSRALQQGGIMVDARERMPSEAAALVHAHHAEATGLMAMVADLEGATKTHKDTDNFLSR
jgi:hypothetical protein